MADGDPITLLTSDVTGYGGFNTNGGSGVAAGWAAANKDAHVTAQADSIETSLQRSGAGCQKTVITTDASTFRKFTLTFNLPGSSGLSARGHMGTKFVFGVYVRRGAVDNGESVYIKVEGLNSANAATTDGAESSEKYPTTSWGATTEANLTIADATTVKFRVTIFCGVDAAKTDATFYLDDMYLAASYTAESNPTGPKGVTSDRSIPQVSEADNNNALWVQRLPAASEKIRNGKLFFGQCSDDQVQAFLSLWRLGAAVTLALNNPDFPASMSVSLGEPKILPLGTAWTIYQMTVPFDEI